VKLEKRKVNLTPFLTVSDVKDGDIITITGEGEYRESKFGKDRLVIPVRLPNGEPRIWTLNQTTINKLIDAYGDETKGWIDKNVKLTVANIVVRGELRKAIYGEPVVTTPVKRRN
jgi:hypothetical protein